MTPDSDSPAVADATETWKRRARVRWTITALLGVLTFVLLTVIVTQASAGPSCHSSVCEPSPQPSQVWVVLSALGTLAAGLGTLVSGLAAILAMRAAATARNTPTAPAKKRRATGARAKKPPMKPRAKR